ncbi:hypothetical protein H4F05_13875 [Vibrio cholerae]
MNETTATMEEGAADLSSIRTHVLITYGLLLLGVFTGGLLSIAGVIWAYVKRADAKGTVFESHFSNATKTFWVSVILSILGVLTLVFVVGYIVLLAALVYSLYKYIKGIARAIDSKSFA